MCRLAGLIGFLQGRRTRATNISATSRSISVFRNRFRDALLDIISLAVNLV